MVRRLVNRDEAALEELLETDPLVNLFLLGFLDGHRVGQWPWYGNFQANGSLLAVALVLPGRLLVPFARSPGDAAPLGAYLHGAHAPCMMIGPRATCDALWNHWAAGTPATRWYDQRLYLCHHVSRTDTAAPIRRALERETEVIAELYGAMQLEDLGMDPRVDAPEQNLSIVRDRIRNGRTLVLERAGEIVFTINVGTSSHWGCQLGGTYVPPSWRGLGIATACTRAVVDRLLKRHSVVTLHVNEANTPAVRAYERVGFSRSEAYRLATV